jgi:predicted TIM-barrel fold metal-dependent hydrolase
MKTEASAESIIEPELPIVDAHHHLYCIPETTLAAMEAQSSLIDRGLAPIVRRNPRYLFQEFLSDATDGHNIRATVFVECHAMYRLRGPESMKSVGEVEFANGVASMAASGSFGDVLVCAGIIGNVDLRLGDAVEEVLRAHIRAGGGRYRGVRCGALTAHDEDTSILGPGDPDVLDNHKFRVGFKWLQKLGLSFDVFVLEPQLPKLVELARSFPETQIIVNHVGVPVNVARYRGTKEERFPIWRKNIRMLSTCANVSIKLGGIGLPLGCSDSFMANPPASSAQIASEWKPYIESCIEAFGVDRCMFESNFPVDSSVGTYAVLWNAFKRLAAGASRAEKTALFSGTATRVYRLDI